jgi:hypothetical protein
LTLGQSSRTGKAFATGSSPTSRQEFLDDELERLEVSCRRKAEAARWAVRREHRLRKGELQEDESAPIESEAAEWADRLTDSFYWLNASDGSPSADLSWLDDVGGCFESMAKALGLVQDTWDHPKVLEQLLPLIAEAQSAVRVSLHRIQAPDDPDQLQIFEWLKATAARHRVYIRRFMRVDDPADPARWPDLLARIEKLEERYSRKGGRTQQKPPATHAIVAERPGSDQPSAEVREVARLLRGRSAVLIGGNRRREAEDALERALGLKELVWLETKQHQAVAAFEPQIARPDVAIVLLAIRWSSHAFGEVKLLCDRHGKPLARLPGGYNPNQVAAQILSQCSAHLDED